MSFCPNKSSKEYKALVSQFGETGAYSAWYQANKELLTETPIPVKPGVKEVFDSNPELAKIGTVQQYSQYLNTVFPNSQVKDIVYHGAMAQLLPKDSFKGYVTYFTDVKNYAETFGIPINRKTISAVIDVKSPYNAPSELADVPKEVHDADEFTNPRIIKSQNKDVDSVIGVDAGQKEGKTIAVFEPNQIRILGSQEDIKGFKKFAENPSEPIIPSIEQANVLLAGRMFNIQDKEFNSYEAEIADIEKKFPPFYGQSAEVLRKIVKAINSTYKYVKASIVSGAQLNIKLDQVQNGTLINKDTLTKLEKLFPKTKLRFISSSTAINMVGEIAKKSPTFIQNDTVYVIDDRVTDETLIEEFLHPFIQYIYTNNRELFDNLYENAFADKALVSSIASRYSKFTVLDKKKEMVTQKLAELLNNNYLTEEPNVIPGIKVQLSKLFKDILRFFNKWLGGTTLEVEELPRTMDLGQLANLLNTTGLELPVEYLAAPTFSLFDDIKNQSLSGGYRLDGDVYKDNQNNSYGRLTEWIRNVIGNGNKKTTVEFAEAVAQREFNKYTPFIENGVSVVKLEDGTIFSLEQLTNKIFIEFETAKAYGTLAHLIIEKAIKSFFKQDVSDLDIKIQTLAAGNATQNPIDLYKMDWIDKNIEPILALAGINTLDDRFNEKERDKILPEIPYILEQLGIGTTIDGLIFHSDGTMSIKDWKTGRLLSDQFESTLLGEFGNQIVDIHDSKLDRARLEVVLRAMMIKYKNPKAIFRSLSVEHLNRNTLLEHYDIDMGSYLALLSDHFKKNDPAKYADFNSKNLFDPTYYGITIHEDLDKAFTDKEETLESLDAQILSLTNTISKEQRTDKKAILRGKLTELTRQRLAVTSIVPSTFANGSEGVSWIKSIFGNLSSVSNSAIRAFKQILDRTTMEYNNEKSKLFSKFDDLTRELMTAHGVNYGNTFLSYSNKAGSGLYDFLYIEKDKGTNKGMYRVTPADDKFKSLTNIQQRWLTFFVEEIESLYNEVAGEVVATDYKGNVTNAQFNNQPDKLPEDFFPRVYMSLGEYAAREGVSKNLLSFKYAQFKNQFLKSEFYANNAVEVIPFKFMGSDASIGSKMHTFNGEIAFKEFTNNLLKKKHFDKVQAIGLGLSQTFFDNKDIQTAKFIEDRILLEIVDAKKKLKFSQKPFSIVTGGKKYQVDIDTFVDMAKGFVTAGTMWLKPFAGMRNGAYTIVTNHKNGIIGSISKRFGIKADDINFTESDMAKADVLWAQMKLDLIAKKDNKLALLLKEYNYLPDSYDYMVHPTNILSKSNKMANTDHLYFFHSVFEDWGTGSIFTALLLHNKNQKTGQSLLDSYTIENGKLKWNGGIRGRRADGSEIQGVTYEELNKFKKVSAAIHGGYRRDERSALELYALGRMAMQFKRFVPQQLMNIAQGRQMSDAYGKFTEILDEDGKVRTDKDGISLYQWSPEVIEGKYRLLYGHLMNVIHLGTNNYDWNNLGPKQKQDLISSYVIIMGTLLGLVMGKGMIPDDEEDKWLAVSYYKVLKDLSEGMNPLDMAENFQYQSVATYKLFKLAKSAGEFFTSVATGEKNKYGKYKSSNEFAKAIPPFSTIYDIDKAFNRTQSGKNIGFGLGNLGSWAEGLDSEDLKLDIKTDWTESK